ncbi:alpha/beta hydrolase [Limnovirga soli]|jgi:hypothetical protein|uniref:Carboxylesterase type B domain-containing protein n=1 Tax=Limnovirga soli TaxID=2656915 RepID=A0A8J8FDB7_9BACT|nr:hypothetical protein [Limnovirga soli]NNV54592.1 hypothetical protein [Limnovirga soli]
MKKMPLIFILSISICYNLKAQDSSIVANICSNFGSAFCSLDLRSSQFTIDSMVGVDTVVYGLATMPADYKDVRYSANSCGVGGSTICQTDPKISLYYQVYYPKKKGNVTINYNNCKFPALILFHGGSYDECGSLYNPGIVFLANEYAKRGFVVFNVEYRRGVLIDTRSDPTTGIGYTTAQQMLAIYRASQDARGAIRSIIKRQRFHVESFPTDPYQIDTTKLFVGGVSAGSVIAMNAVYYQKQIMIDAAFPGINAALGSINQNFYYGDTTINFAPIVKGVFNMWGAMLIPKGLQNNPKLFFANNDYMPPIISFCGKDDQIFQFDGELVYFSPSAPNALGYLNTETNCLLTSSYTVPGTDANSDLFQLGSSNIYDMFREMTISTEFYLDCTMMHGLDDDCILCGGSTKNKIRDADHTCVACVFDSDFGTGLLNSDDVNVYIVGRGATFFQGAMGTDVLNNLLITKFVECKNNRYGCDTTNANACPYTTVEGQDQFDCIDWEQ